MKYITLIPAIGDGKDIVRLPTVAALPRRIVSGVGWSGRGMKITSVVRTIASGSGNGAKRIRAIGAEWFLRPPLRYKISRSGRGTGKSLIMR